MCPKCVHPTIVLQHRKFYDISLLPNRSYGYGNCKFSPDGSKMVFLRESSKILAFAIEDADIPLIWSSEVGILNLPAEWFVTSEHVLLLNTNRAYLEVFSMINGAQSGSTKWSPMDNPGASNPNILGEVFITRQYLLTTMASYLQLLDLRTLEAKLFNTRATEMSLLSTFDEGKLAALQIEGRLYFLDLKSGNPEEIFRRRREVKLEETQTCLRSREIIKFCEVTKELSFREIFNRWKSQRQYEIMALKPVRLSKALETWLNHVAAQ